MSCNTRSPYAKSCIRVYNDTPQVVTADATPLILEGVPVVYSGCSLTLNTGSVTVEKSGLYHLSADVTITPSAAGTLIVQLNKDGVVLPCAVTRDIVSTNPITVHVETDLIINTCCINQPVITVVTRGVAGTVNHVCAGVLKLA